MLDRLRQRVSDEAGFTLIELLVVILIIGILAAIAIPAFLSQTKKAYDSSAKTLAQTAQTAAETFGTENGGSYTGLSIEKLHKIEPTISESESVANGPALVNAGISGEADEYTVTAMAQSTEDEFSITRNSEGETIRECKLGPNSAGTNGCKVTGTNTTGTW